MFIYQMKNALIKDQFLNECCFSSRVLQHQLTKLALFVVMSVDKLLRINMHKNRNVNKNAYYPLYLGCDTHLTEECSFLQVGALSNWLTLLLQQTKFRAWFRLHLPTFTLECGQRRILFPITFFLQSLIVLFDDASFMQAYLITNLCQILLNILRTDGPCHCFNFFQYYISHSMIAS